jgi:hypothetical protein
MNLKELISHADNIPDLGYGGKTVKDDLMYYSSKVKSDRNIIDIAPCFGSTTAYIHCGLEKSGRSLISVYSFDMWELQNDEYKNKAKKYCNVELNSSDDFYNEYLKNIKPYGQTNVIRGDILKQSWNSDNKIGLFINDIGASKEYTDKIFQIFSPAFVKNETIIMMMDYYFYESKHHTEKQYLYQKKFMEKNKNVFDFIKKVEKSKCAIYKYLGGEINYEVEE